MKKTTYCCKECGTIQIKWAGRCPECEAWNSLEERKTDDPLWVPKAVVKRLGEINLEKQSRLITEVSELDRTLGGGIVVGSVILVGGEPGIGKSTLLMQVLGNLGAKGKVLYVTGEESLEQVASRSKRLGVVTDNLFLLAETKVEKILAVVDEVQPRVLVIDSIQTVFTELVDAAPGGSSQLREATAKLVHFSKTHGLATLIVGHVTKEGVIAGPKILEHMVDCVLYFEGGEHTKFRVIRCVKNRFGAVNEIGVFAMTEQGLKEVKNPSAIFLSARAVSMPGSSIAINLEGTRPMLVEIQALVDESFLPNPRRTTVGYDVNRMAMMLAILHRHGRVTTHNRDIFVNVVGGVKISETASDLPLLLAVCSSLKERALPADLASFGEIGLGGEVRPVANGQERIKIAKQHHFKRLMIPVNNLPKYLDKEIELLPIATVAEGLRIFGE